MNNLEKLRKNMRKSISEDILKLINQYGHYYDGWIIRPSEHEAFNAAIKAASAVALGSISDFVCLGEDMNLIDMEKNNRCVDDDDDDHTSVWGGAGPDCINGRLEAA